MIDPSEFQDISPLDLNKVSQPIASIAYSPEYVFLLSIFFAILESKEVSQRVLRLTKEIVLHNPAHYTVWNYRQVVLDKLNSYELLRQELEYLDEFMLDHPKNYQLWRHRQFVLLQLQSKLGNSDGNNYSSQHQQQQQKKLDLVSEFQFLLKIFNDDGKNYHAWTFRLWLLNEFPIYWESELNFIDYLLEKDFRNNSVWNHRYNYVSRISPISDELRDLELDIVKKFIRTAPNNESSWNYLRGFISLLGKPLSIVEDFCVDLFNIQHSVSPHLYSCLADICILKKDFKQAKFYFSKLADSIDPVRMNYWNYRANKIPSE